MECLKDIKRHYLDEIRAMWRITQGGTLRSRKGKLVETMAKKAGSLGLGESWPSKPCA